MNTVDILVEEVGNNLWLQAMSTFGIEWLQEHFELDASDPFHSTHTLQLVDADFGLLGLMDEAGLTVIEGIVRI